MFSISIFLIFLITFQLATSAILLENDKTKNVNSSAVLTSQEITVEQADLGAKIDGTDYFSAKNESREYTFNLEGKLNIRIKRHNSEIKTANATSSTDLIEGNSAETDNGLLIPDGVLTTTEIIGGVPVTPRPSLVDRCPPKVPCRSFGSGKVRSDRNESLVREEASSLSAAGKIYDPLFINVAIVVATATFIIQ